MTPQRLRDTRNELAMVARILRGRTRRDGGDLQLTNVHVRRYIDRTLSDSWRLQRAHVELARPLDFFKIRITQ
jgi:hypothetical protein